MYLPWITNLILYECHWCHGKECALWCSFVTRETTAFNRKRCIMRWRSSLRSHSHSLQIIRADVWQEIDPTTTPNWSCFLSIGNTIFSGSRVAKQRKLTFSWLLMKYMTALRVYYTSNYCDNMPTSMQFTRTKHQLGTKKEIREIK